MENINQLTNLGFKIFKRFVFVILAVMAISIVFMLLVFYHSFGSDITEFDFGSVIDTLLDILPTDIISPFQNCNTPQLVVMGALFGAALLILGEKVSGVTNAIIQINSWVVKAMDIVLIVMPVIPTTGDGFSAVSFLLPFYAKMLKNGLNTEVLSTVTIKLRKLDVKKLTRHKLSNKQSF